MLAHTFRSPGNLLHELSLMHNAIRLSGSITPKNIGVPKNDILVLLDGVSETIEILTVTGAETGSFVGDCNLGVYTSRYAHLSPILG